VNNAIHAEFGDGVLAGHRGGYWPHVLVADAGGIDAVHAVIGVVVVLVARNAPRC
jgi:hypothetical protein